MARISIPCQHETGKAKDHSQQIPDHHPLNGKEIKGLLDLSASSSSATLLASIQVRLTQGIKGMKCPREYEGPVAERSSQVDALFVKRHREGGTTKLVEEFNRLLNG